MNEHAKKVIDALGGNAAVARLFNISGPSVSNWRNDGIPRARMMYLQVVRAHDLDGIDLEAATSLSKPAEQVTSFA